PPPPPPPSPPPRYYSWLSASIIDDDAFVSVLEAAWGIKEVSSAEVRYRICAKAMKECAYKQVKGCHDDVKAKHVLLNVLRHFDLENKGGLTIPQFRQATQRLTCTLNDEFAQLFFDKFATDGVLDYKLMADDMYAEP
ncbi:hypothetical protein TeGR_g10050, partial [Tetraparma gracilis]